MYELAQYVRRLKKKKFQPQRDQRKFTRVVRTTNTNLESLDNIQM